VERSEFMIDRASLPESKIIPQNKYDSVGDFGHFLETVSCSMHLVLIEHLASVHGCLLKVTTSNAFV